jgi:hypothetical protein
MSDYYLIAALKSEPLETARFLFDYEYYLKNRRNIRLFKTFKLKNKVDAWKHFIKHNRHKALNYRFQSATKKAQIYYNYLQGCHFNIDGSNFDNKFYLEHNRDVKTALDIAKPSNINFPWRHFVTNGLYEMRPFKILNDEKEIPHGLQNDCQSECRSDFQSDCQADSKSERNQSMFTDATSQQETINSKTKPFYQTLFTDQQIIQALANLLVECQPFQGLLEQIKDLSSSVRAQDRDAPTVQEGSEGDKCGSHQLKHGGSRQPEHSESCQPEHRDSLQLELEHSESHQPEHSEMRQPEHSESRQPEHSESRNQKELDLEERISELEIETTAKSTVQVELEKISMAEE